MSNPEIKKFIDFFHNAALKVRKQKPRFIHGKDGKLVKLALGKLTREQLEQMAIWFLEKKQTLGTTIGAMLSEKVLETLRVDMNRPGFWAELNNIYDKYFPRPSYSKEFLQKFQPFTSKQISEIQEEMVTFEHQKRFKH